MGGETRIEEYKPGRRVRTAQERRTLSIALWIVYLALYVIALRSTHGSLHGPVLVLGIAFPWIVSLSTKRAVADYNRALGPSLASLRSGDAARAELELRALAERFAWPRFLRRLTAYNLGLALLRQGKLDEALARFVDADRRGGWVTIDGSLAASLSMMHSLANRVEMAEAWLVEARQRYTLVTTKSPFSSLQAEVLLDLRKGRFAEVHHRLESGWAEIEYAMKGESLRPLRVLRAFSATRSAAYREGATAGASLAALEPIRPGEFDYLAVAWPDLGRFLAEHGAPVRV